MKKTDNSFPDPIPPPRLAKGDIIGIAAPAGPIVEEDNFNRGVRLLHEMGFLTRISRGLMKKEGYLAGSDSHRITEFHDLWADREVKAIIAARGGYGSLRMLSGLDMDLIRHHPKPFIGFSDATVLLTAILKHTGIYTFHGPMVTTIAKGDRESAHAFFRMLTRIEPDSIKPAGLEILAPGRAQGRLIGGNLTSLVHMLATAHELTWQNCILFIEEINETGYRVDRMLTHLKEAGRLNSITGLILGNFKECGDPEIIWNRVMELLGEQGIPIWANFPVGHGNRNLILPLGIKTEMDSASGTLNFLQPPFLPA
ncbi:MAG: LD-carboxypeptidase [Desulfobulbaceae bacterium]|nr:LD-carboxypeptidase [Desulfobulbaceae bacterium]